uniref:SUN domain-containing protein n=1 Tax=Mycena chlorophos TaxID=658473 RepID=A0ABQ0LAZ5_MYCCL|nr:predicted protein [Mycena chlorophos]
MPPRPILLLFLPALCSLVIAAPPTTPNDQDPFKALAVHVVKAPEQPICCLVPLASDSKEEDLLLSFEEWKEKQAAMDTQNVVGAGESEVAAAVTGSTLEGPGTTVVQTEKTFDGSAEPTVDNANQNAVAPPPDSPHFRVPLTDRFNYASLDCSARVHTSHKTAKSALSILSYKRDKYMLSPCRDPQSQFVVVELCDDIRIDTVQLANFEFFSGVFKDFTVSVAKTYTTDPDGWTPAGTYTAKNIRVVQSFHPPTTLRDFYRFIRIDFHSHYGSEYYCPVSLLRVYGLTHLEEYKWDVWQEESRARMAASSSSSTAASTPIDVSEPEPAPSPELRIPPSYSEYISARESAGSVLLSPEEPPSVIPNDTEMEETAAPSSEVPTLATQASSTSKDGDGTTSQAASYASTTSTTGSSATGAGAITVASISESTPISSLHEPEIPPPPPSSPSNSNSNSIYRTIMNRLSALEANHTLFTQYMEEHRVYARYVEEHTAAVRELLRRVGEDMGRADGIAKAQAAKWDKQRRWVEKEHMELMRKVEYLSGEIILEKRLGIAQLLLLLAVLVFLTLTRGSPGSPIAHVPIQASASASLRAWGRRHLSLRSSRSRTGSGADSGDDWDWVGRLKREKDERESRRNSDAHVEFPSIQHKSVSSEPIPTAAPTPVKPVPGTPPAVTARDTPGPSRDTTLGKHKPTRLALSGTESMHRPRTRSVGNNTLVFEAGHPHRSLRTPTTTSKTPASHAYGYRRSSRPGTPTRIHGYYAPVHASAGVGPFPMTHSLSQGSHGGPRSARKWARTAHLHELRSPASVTEGPTPDNGKAAELAAGEKPARMVSEDTARRPRDEAASLSPSPSPSPLPPSGSGSHLGSGKALRWGLPNPGVLPLQLHHGMGAPSSSNPPGDVFGGPLSLDGDDGDGDSQWVDTDDGESEAGDASLRSPLSPKAPLDPPPLPASTSASSRDSSEAPSSEVSSPDHESGQRIQPEVAAVGA